MNDPLCICWDHAGAVSSLACKARSVKTLERLRMLMASVSEDSLLSHHHARKGKHTHMHTRVHTHIFTHKHAQTHTYTNTRIHTYTHIQACRCQLRPSANAWQVCPSPTQSLTIHTASCAWTLFWLYPKSLLRFFLTSKSFMFEVILK